MKRTAFLLLPALSMAIVLAMSKLHAAVVAVPSYDFTERGRVGWAVAYALAAAVISYGAGLPDVPATRAQAARASAGASVGAALAVSAAQLVTGDALLPRFVVFGSAGAFLIGNLVLAELSTQGDRRARDRVVLIGASADARALESEFEKGYERPAELLAVLDPTGTWHTGSGDPAGYLETLRPDVVVLDREAQAHERVVEAVSQLHRRGIRVRTLNMFYEEWLGKVPLGELRQVALLFDIGELHRRRYVRIKRAFDVAVAIPMLAMTLALAPIVIVGNLAGNRGALLYRQERVGRNGDIFTILKFRTMVPSASSGEWTAPDDPRVTAFGRVLRRLHLDELPQSLNILRGELAVVGPRPEQPRYVVHLRDRLPFYDDRHLVMPGLTGWAQVKAGYVSSDEGALHKLQYEFFYLRHQSVRMDLRVLARTIRAVVGGRGR